MNSEEAKVAHRCFWDRAKHFLDLRPVGCLLVLYALSVAVYIASIPLPRADGHLVGSDGTYYYAYLPTLLIDRDLDFSNQYARLFPPRRIENDALPQDPRRSNPYAVGCAVLWAPFFGIGHAIALMGRMAGSSVALDGIGYAYQAPVLIGSISYGFAGVLLVYGSCRRFFSRSASVSAALLIWLATSLIYYMIAEPSMSHACSFFAAALLVNLWLRFRPLPGFRQWALLGVAGGLVALVRLPDATWLALPCIDAALNLRVADRGSVGRLALGVVCFAVVAAIVFSPQIMVWTITDESPNGIDYGNSGSYFQWSAPRMLPVLFSLRHGLFSWHPLLLPATLGLILLSRRDRSLAIALGVLFIAQIYVIGAWNGWYGGDAFGARMLISSLPALALGLAALIDRASAHEAWSAVGLLGCILIVWNALFFAQYRFGYISKSDTITLRQMTLGKAILVKDLTMRAYKAVR
ncbi:MAG: hypothetical protein QUT30_00705 [Acidobacteriota bacterium]|nr:hypothetical protein [Acidobacteriota bacterium]